MEKAHCGGLSVLVSAAVRRGTTQHAWNRQRAMPGKEAAVSDKVSQDLPPAEFWPALYVNPLHFPFPFYNEKKGSFLQAFPQGY